MLRLRRCRRGQRRPHHSLFGGIGLSVAVLPVEFTLLGRFHWEVNGRKKKPKPKSLSYLSDVICGEGSRKLRTRGSYRLPRPLPCQHHLHLGSGSLDAVLHSLCRSSLGLHLISSDTHKCPSPQVGGTSHQALRSVGSSSILLEHGVFIFTPTIENGWPAPGGDSTTPGRAIWNDGAQDIQQPRIRGLITYRSNSC